jgi:uncharacterized protein
MAEADLRNQLNSDLKTALRGGEKVKLSVIRTILAGMKNSELARQEKLMAGFLKEHQVTSTDDEAARQAKLNEVAREVERITPQVKLSDGDILGIISKEAKQREESIAAYKAGNRPDLVAQEEAELAIIKTYLPQQATRDDIAAIVKQVIAEVGAQGPRDKGKVMPKVIAQLKGRADGREINEVVTELLK